MQRPTYDGQVLDFQKRGEGSLLKPVSCKHYWVLVGFYTTKLVEDACDSSEVVVKFFSSLTSTEEGLILTEHRVLVASAHFTWIYNLNASPYKIIQRK
ncbi:uncharacterized protein PHALS_12577 [Plasmopara halstedii]|uniref:Uncharacterized protein n=1 Tax=Plasmopara halstedii TaxID=4781 RepID=A0A0P1AMU3_PLAHL|nr:uncharacterized protein PHALS_12577 [Plasmopara halstedii]CEG42289.1 hypothetical protein PHALS_12577 [Plasmopara halstedii]|eukprot:XP_024578658.1 hypothetical protein PHALS_12577 [Plasmopara halstedii]